MSYKPDDKDFMDYLYNEMDFPEKEKFERYLFENPEAKKKLAGFQQLSSMLGTVKDKEVIAPPIVIGEGSPRFLWNAPYLKTIISIAASLLLIIVAGRLAGVHVTASKGAVALSFGDHQKETVTAAPTLTATEVQEMINSSMNQNNEAMQANWKQTQEELDSSIKKNLASNSGKIDALMKQASSASQEQIRLYVAGLQSQNIQVVKDYFQLSQGEQKKYIENLLVDFAKYLQQQRNDDLQLVQVRLESLEQNTDLFKQETEQILSSIITNVGNGSAPVNVTRY